MVNIVRVRLLSGGTICHGWRYWS